jgi:hypothetical protein
MFQFKKAQLHHEEFVVCVFGKEIPISAIKTGLLGSFIIMVALMSYLLGKWEQQQTMNWFAYYSDKGLCTLMQNGNGEFIVICSPKSTPIPYNVSQNNINLSRGG